MPFPDQIEIVVALNRCTDRTEEIAVQHGAKLVHDGSKNLAKIRNAAAKVASGEVLVTIDADSRMTSNMLVEIERLLRTGKYVGGGVMIWPERWSLGIVMTALVIAPLLVRHRVSGGLFWCLRKDFEAIGGFDENLSSLEDIDFAKRLKARGKRDGRRFGTITKAHIITSFRKFDQFGDWYLLKNPRLLWRLLDGRSQDDANRYWYDVER